MLRQLKITNFRSIQKDTVNFDSPITIVIGANGTGKTNLILALKFLSSCLSDTPVRAIQKAGGLDKVFSVRERRTQKCGFEVHYTFTKENESKESEITFDFEEAIYNFELKFDDITKRIIISNESLRARKIGNLIFDDVFSREHKNDRIVSTGNYFLEVKQDSFFSTGVSNRLFLSYGSGPFRSSGYHLLMERLSDDLTAITGYNFDPQMIRRSSDLLSNADLSYDGKGFASLIYRILSKKHIPYRTRSGKRIVGSQKIEENLKDIYEDVLPFLHSFNSIEEMDSTTVDLKFTEEQQIGTSRTFTADHLSDGTLKFLAIVTAILVLPEGNLLFLEEIENYLNPKAIRRIIQLMRDHSESYQKTFILTTHSETVLNQMKPSEVLISRRTNNGSTKYTKFKELKNIQSAIDESGISLGTYWAKGGLDAF